ncbi:hypothetical protein DB347_23985 [Opitutaceae bacterium EW11]|nr:hypothetical protein DB347_23985 [Opitutaceae bacterium EW11]
MHKISKLTLSAVVTLSSLPLLSSAATIEQDYVDSYRDAHRGNPVPVAVVAPWISSPKTGEVDLEFVVDTQGRPKQITVKSASSSALISPVTAAVSEWKFIPAEKNGVPVERKVILPVRIVPTE